MLYIGQADRHFPEFAPKLPRPRNPMLRISILVAVSFALAITQTLAVNCDLRCALMGQSSGNRSCGQHAAMPMGHEQIDHCHGMSMHAGNEASAVMSGNRCEATFCKAELVAIMKSSATEESLSHPSAITLPAPLPLPGRTGASFRMSAFWSVHREARNAPLDVRPGSSLRI